MGTPWAAKWAAGWAALSPRTRHLGVAAGAVGLAVLVAVPIGFAVRDDDVIDGELAAAREPDPVPQGRLVADLPYECGLSFATIDRLTGGPDKKHTVRENGEECVWETGAVAYAGTGGPSRELSVSLTKGNDKPRSEASEEFIRLLDTETRPVGMEPGPVRILAGLGDEAVIWDQVDLNGALYPHEDKPRDIRSRSARTTILLRYGNVVARVAYAGADYTPKDGDDVIPDLREKLLSEKTTQGAAMAAARDVLEHLGGRPDGTPHVLEQPRQPSAAAPTACALVPKPTLGRLGDAGLDDAGPKQTRSYLIEGEREDLTADGCEWNGTGALLLETEIVSAKDGRTGPGSLIIGREYVNRYFSEQEREPEADGNGPGEQLSGALKGLGDRAFFAYRRDSARSGEIYLQRRNVLVRVRCWSIEEPSKNKVLDCAYRAAREADRHVRG